jgi:aconitate hydratase
MIRGTFANVRLRNELVSREGPYTIHFPDNKEMTIYDAAMKYMEKGIPLIIIAGKEYGSGSSRDWAAKGVSLLGVKAIIAESFERIHRSNLVGMGVLPLELNPGQTVSSFALEGDEIYDILGLDELTPNKIIPVTITGRTGTVRSLNVIARLDSPIEVEYYRNGGILQYVLRNFLQSALPGSQSYVR